MERGHQSGAGRIVVKAVWMSCLGGGGYPSRGRVLPPPKDGWRVIFTEAKRYTIHQKDLVEDRTLCGVFFENRRISYRHSVKTTCGNCIRTREMKE